MSATGRSETDLRSARDALQRRGYLGAPPPPRPLWRRAGRTVATAAAFALVLALIAVASAREDLASVPAVAVGLLPACLAALGAALLLGRIASRSLLAAGGRPAAIATALAAVAAGAVALAGVAAILGARRAADTWVALLLVVVAVAAAWVFRRASTVLSADLVVAEPTASEPPTPRRARSAVIFAATVIVLVAILVLAGGRQHPPEPAAPTSFPALTGRVAVVAVDGLALQDLNAATRLLGRRPPVLDWGHAELELDRASLPAVRWTTIACGAPPDRHGVEVMEEVVLFGRRDGVAVAPALQRVLTATWGPVGGARVTARPALTRRLPTFWEMASRAGCPVTVGGWWGSWPVRRVLGTVASERAWLGGGWGRDAATPDVEEAVAQAWLPRGNAADVTDTLARALADRAAAGGGPRLVALWMPGPDLVRRGDPDTGPIDLAARILPHLDALERVLATLRSGGFEVWAVFVPWGPGTPFVASSAVRGSFAPVRETELASTWIDQLGLPAPVGLPGPRRDLSGAAGTALPAVAYGPPPLPRAAPSPTGAAVQREVLRSLGYLR